MTFLFEYTVGDRLYGGDAAAPSQAIAEYVFRQCGAQYVGKLTRSCGDDGIHDKLRATQARIIRRASNGETR